MPLSNKGWVCAGGRHSWQIEDSFQCWAVNWVTDSIQWEFGTFVFLSLLSSSLIFLIQSNKVYFWLYSMSKFVLLWIWRIGRMKGRGQIFLSLLQGVSPLKYAGCCFCRCSCIAQILGEKGTTSHFCQGSVLAPLQLSTPTTERSEPAFSW